MMKFKPNQTRTYDGEGFKRRAACLCFRNEKEDEVSSVRRGRSLNRGGLLGRGPVCRSVSLSDTRNRLEAEGPGILSVKQAVTHSE